MFKKTVDSIIADIKARIEHLHIVADAHKAEAAIHDEAIKVKLEAMKFAQDEYARAKRIAEKFEELVS